MKIFFTLAFLITLIPVALAGQSFEVHNGHDHDESMVSEHAPEKESKESDSHGECPHFHVHCTSLCLGVFLGNTYVLNPSSYSSAESQFSFVVLSPQDYSNSLYRPPIA